MGKLMVWLGRKLEHQGRQFQEMPSGAVYEIRKKHFRYVSFNSERNPDVNRK